MQPVPGTGRWAALLRWFDTSVETPLDERADRIDWLRTLPFIALHLACFAVFWVGVSWFAVSVAIALYAVRMFALTGFYHRYFSHKAFRTSRPVQFFFAAASFFASDMKEIVVFMLIIPVLVWRSLTQTHVEEED